MREGRDLPPRIVVAAHSSIKHFDGVHTFRGTAMQVRLHDRVTAVEREPDRRIEEPKLIDAVRKSVSGANLTPPSCRTGTHHEARLLVRSIFDHEAVTSVGLTRLEHLGYEIGAERSPGKERRIGASRIAGILQKAKGGLRCLLCIRFNDLPPD